MSYFNDVNQDQFPSYTTSVTTYLYSLSGGDRDGFKSDTFPANSH